MLIETTNPEIKCILETKLDNYYECTTLSLRDNIIFEEMIRHLVVEGGGVAAILTVKELAA